jgi:hypothetical protein
MTEASATIAPAAPVPQPITHQSATQAFEDWENKYRAEPATFLTVEECAAMDGGAGMKAVRLSQLREAQQCAHRVLHSSRVPVAHLANRVMHVLSAIGACLVAGQGLSEAAPLPPVQPPLQTVYVGSTHPVGVGRSSLQLSQPNGTDGFGYFIEFLAHVPPECHAVAYIHAQEKREGRPTCGGKELLSQGELLLNAFLVLGLPLVGGLIVGMAPLARGIKP